MEYDQETKKVITENKETNRGRKKGKTKDYKNYANLMFSTELLKIHDFDLRVKYQTRMCFKLFLKHIHLILN